MDYPKLFVSNQKEPLVYKGINEFVKSLWTLACYLTGKSLKQIALVVFIWDLSCSGNTYETMSSNNFEQGNFSKYNEYTETYHFSSPATKD